MNAKQHKTTLVQRTSAASLFGNWARTATPAGLTNAGHRYPGSDHLMPMDTVNALAGSLGYECLIVIPAKQPIA